MFNNEKNTNYELELYVLYYLIRYNEKYNDYEIRKDIFAFDVTQEIFLSFQKKVIYGLSFNFNNVKELLANDFKEIDVDDFIHSFDVVSLKYLSLFNLQQAINSLRDLSDKRLIEGLVAQQQENIADDSKNAQEIKESIIEGLEDIKDFKKVSRSVDMKKAMLEAFQDRQESIKTHFPKLDQVITGFEKGSFVVVAGASSMGKSAMATSLILNLVKKDQPLALFSFEMSVAQITRRLIANLGSLNLTKLKEDNLTSQYEQESFVKQSEALIKMPITLNDDAMLDLQGLRKEIKTLIKTKKTEVFIIDYVQLIKHNSKGGEVQRITEITNYLKALALELKIVIIGLSQLSREVAKRDNKRPILADLRSSGSIEQDADCVIFLFRPEYYLKNEKPIDETSSSFREWQDSMNKLKNVAYVIVAKNRDGGLGDVKFNFEGEFMRFTENQDI